MKKKPVLTELAVLYCKTEISLFADLCKATGKTPSGILMCLHRNSAPILHTSAVLELIEKYTGLEKHKILANPS